MAEKNQMVSRLKNEGQRIRSMVNPWTRSFLPGFKTAGHLSEVPLSIGKKSQLAIKKMRFINPEKQGNIQPETYLHQAKLIKDKTSQYHQLLHINPHVSRDTGLWSKVDQVLPTAPAAGPDMTAEPGVLKQGSIIPKMSVLPKEGQSFAEFKAQMQSNESLKPKSPALPERKPQPSPNSRLYARVQEFTNNEPQDVSEEDRTERDELPGRLAAQSPATPQSSPPAVGKTVLRQVETPEESSGGPLPPPPSEEKQTVSHRNPSRAASTPRESFAPPAGSPDEVLLPPTAETPKQAAPVSAQKAVPVRSVDAGLEKPLKLLTAKPVTPKTEPLLLKARPVPLKNAPQRAASQVGQKSKDVALPPAHPAPSIASTARVVQRQPDKPAPDHPGKPPAIIIPGVGFDDGPDSKDQHAEPDVFAPSEPTRMIDAFSNDRPGSLQEPGRGKNPGQSKDASAPGLEKPIRSTPDKGEPHIPVEMVLQKRLEAKKTPPLQIRSLDAGQLRTSLKTGRILPPAQNLIKMSPAGKRMPSPALEDRKPAGSPLKSSNFNQGTENQELIRLLGQQGGPPPPFLSQVDDREGKALLPDSGPGLLTSTAAIFKRLPMDLPHPQTMAPVPPKTSSQSPDVNRKDQSTPGPASSESKPAGNKVVQRLGNDLMEDIQTVGGKLKDKVMGKSNSGGEENASGESGAGMGSPNLEKLAEDVFPLIKRLLEIEISRTGNFR